MRYQELNELSGVKKFANMDHQQVIAYLEKTLGSSNFRQLGSGAQGYGILVGDKVYKFWMVDSAYTDFVNYAKQNGNNPFMPKFLSEIRTMPAFFLRDKSAPDRVNYIKMERLTKIPGAVEDLFFTQELINSSGRFYKIDLDVQSIIRCATYENTYDDVLHGLSNAFDVKIDVTSASDELRTFINTLLDLRKIGNHALDLENSPGNFMMRGEQLVILDPLYNKEDNGISNSLMSFVDLSKSQRKSNGKSGVTSSSATQSQKQ